MKINTSTGRLSAPMKIRTSTGRLSAPRHTSAVKVDEVARKVCGRRTNRSSKHESTE